MSQRASDASHCLGEHLTDLSSNAREIRVLDRLHGCHGIYGADFPPSGTCRTMTLQGSMAPTLGSMPIVLYAIFGLQALRAIVRSPRGIIGRAPHV